MLRKGWITCQKKLANGTVKIYTSYEFKVDGKTYSCKKYVDFTLEIVDMDGARIDKVLVTLTHKNEEDN